MSGFLDPGVVIVDKPKGWTSHQVVGRLRRVLGTRKVGHAGTLDPMATGVLVVGVNRATRLLGHLMLTQKRYTATMRLGVTTTTDDAEGEITSSPGASGVTEDDVRRAMAQFTGRIEQVPTAVSAIKVDGKRAYQRVRDGEDVELAARPVTVERFDLLEVRHAGDAVPVLDCDVEVVCSSGTYIRALARDVGKALGVGGHLIALRRTQVGPFTLHHAQALDDGMTVADVDMLPIADVARLCFPGRQLDGDAATRVRHGRRLEGWALTGVTALFDGPEFLALYGPDGRDAVATAVFV
ncbi:tRNA pseudouridine(55) synthase TruB [Propioniferax innocua]|uniref:tRNA pseudouridine synthase B n=1 Tax=Propioniferax innocua TaxID=1753 RepID=A0A542ZAH2_9ACTN|nr:tRNA pseudouridine(55) synthase TruB [Propioniferax innocua]TQL57315.1 tRNA pseudouridine synthase B [Propioniferax innocua]